MSRSEYILKTRRIVPFEGDPSATALHIRDGKIIKVGDEHLAATAASQDIPVIDRQDFVAMPGFVDPHVHLEHQAVGSARGVDCRYPTVKSIGDILDALSSAEPYKGWILGYGNLFLDQKLADRRLPTREELDGVSTSTPIAVQCGGHVSVLNSAALNLLPDYVFAAGTSGLWGAPRIDRDEFGNPTGVVAEIDGHLPTPTTSLEEREEYLKTAARTKFLQYGVTTLGEMTESRDSIELYQRLTVSGEIAQRVRSLLMVPAVADEDEAIAIAKAYKNDATTAARYAVNGIKVFADGGYSARNAAVLSAYLPGQGARRHDKGRINLPYSNIRHLLEKVRSADVRLAIHTNGSRAQFEALEAILDSGDPLEHLPVRIEHLGNVIHDPSILQLIKRSGVQPVMQPGFLHTFIGDFLPVVLGEAGRQGRVPLRTLLDEGIVPAVSSDTTLGADDCQSNPLFTADVARGRYSYWGEEIDPWETVSVEETLRLHTIEAARALSLENEIGSLVPGKQADIVLYEEDPRTYQGPLPALRPKEVLISGEVVHNNE